MSKKKAAKIEEPSPPAPQALECLTCGFRDGTLQAKKCPICGSKLVEAY